MILWLKLTQRGTDHTVMVNMNLVTHMTPNNPRDLTQGSALFFGFNENYIVVDETLGDITRRMELKS